MNWTIVNLVVWPLGAGFFFFNWLHERRQAARWRYLERQSALTANHYREKFEFLQNSMPMQVVDSEISRTVNELQNENAQLRGDVETGCKVIDNLRGRLKEQTDLLNRMTAENRRFLGVIKRKR